MIRYTDKGELFTVKLLQYYESSKPILASIISEREILDEISPEDEDISESTAHKLKVLKLYDKSEYLKRKDTEISDALYATALWYIHMNLLNETVEFISVDEESGKITLLYNEIVNYLIRKYAIISTNGTIYIYINNMYYVDHGRLSKDIVKLLKEHKYSDTKRVEPIVKEVIFRILKETEKYKNFPFNTKSEYLIPVQNGVVVRRNLNELLPKSPVWGFTYSLPVNYNKDASYKTIKTFIDQIVDGEDREILIQIAAQAIRQNEYDQRSYLMTGTGANGKSTFLQFLIAFIGNVNITAISLQELVEDKFKAAELQGKLMDVYADLPKTSLKSIGKYKILTGGDYITVERKFAQPFTMKNKAVFVFSANELPHIEDSTYAFWRRWDVLEFPHTFQNDPNFTKNLITEENLSGFLNLVIKKLEEIDRNGSLSSSSKVKEIMEKWLMHSNSAYAFVKNCIVKDMGSYIVKDDLAKEYLQYCNDSDLTPQSVNKLTEEIEKISESTQMVIDRDGAKVRKKVFKAIRRVTDPKSELQEELDMTAKINADKNTVVDTSTATELDTD